MCRSTELSLWLGRQAEDPLADDVLLNLVGAAVDRLRPAEQERTLELVELVRGRLRHLTRLAADVHGQLAELLVPGSPEELDDRRLGWGRRSVVARQAAQSVVA